MDGIFNLAGQRFTWAEFMKLIGAGNIVWVSADIINAAGLTFMELPLYRPERGPRSSLMDVSNARAIAAGLTLTDPAISVRDMREWMGGREQAPMLSPEREAELIRLARSNQNNIG
jgi:2'-hydroxyisoflavone reductase